MTPRNERDSGRRQGRRPAQRPGGRVAGSVGKWYGRFTPRQQSAVPAEQTRERPPARKGASVRGRKAAASGHTEPLATSEPQRLQKVMAHAGIASRRRCEELILAGRVRVNGELVTALGSRVRPGVDRVEVDGRSVGAPEEHVYLLLNKPKGFVTTLFDPQGRAKVTDLLGDIGSRVYPVGRLDFDSEGLLLLTNDGELANRLMHPAHQMAKTYMARVRGIPSDRKLRDLAEGIELEDGLTAPADVRLLKTLVDRSNTRNQAADVEITIHEGRNRQVRRMFAAVGHEVITLRRVRLGPLQLGGLAPGHHRPLDDRELRALQQSLGLAVTHPAGTKAPGRVKRVVGAPAGVGRERPSVPVAEAPSPSVAGETVRPQPRREGQARPRPQPRGEGQARPRFQPRAGSQQRLAPAEAPGERRPAPRLPKTSPAGSVGAPSASRPGSARPGPSLGSPRPAPGSRNGATDAKARPRIVKFKKTAGKAPHRAPTRPDGRR